MSKIEINLEHEHYHSYRSQVCERKLIHRVPIYSNIYIITFQGRRIDVRTVKNSIEVIELRRAFKFGPAQLEAGLRPAQKMSRLKKSWPIWSNKSHAQRS